MIKAPTNVAGEVIDEVTLKGVSRPIKIYSLTRPENPLSNRLKPDVSGSSRVGEIL